MAKPKPVYLHVLGRRYELVPYESDNNIGEVSHWNHQVFINNDACIEEAVDCVVHELLHTVEAHLSAKIREQDIKKLETVVVSMMRDNGVDLAPLERKIKLARRRYKNAGIIVRSVSSED